MSENNNIRLLQYELCLYCHSELLSEEGLREIIERYGLTANNDNHDYVEDYDFFREACFNERVTEGIIQFLLEYFPDAANYTDELEQKPLHFACHNKNVTLGIIQLLITANPASVRSVNDNGNMPLHILSVVKKVDEANAVQILKLLIEKSPEAVSHANNKGILPIHFACMWRSPEFCRVLTEAYPGSERIIDGYGALPLHSACHNNVAVVEYLYNLFPNAINTTTTGGFYPIHSAILGIQHGDNPAAAVKVLQFLLANDPVVKLQKYDGESLLHFACRLEYDDSNIHGALAVIKVIYDFYPQAMEENEIMSDVEGYHQEVQVFVLIQLSHARQAKVHRLMTTPDTTGQLPLHTALRNNSVSFGSIKLLVKGNPEALQSADNSGALPLHVACQYHDSVSAIQYLVELDPTTLDAMDRNGNTSLHYACRGARHHIIALFLDEFDAASVSTRNRDGKLPIDLLWESNAVEVEDRESIEFTESIYRLLRANPEMIMGIDVQMMQSSASMLASPCQAGKKRKLGQ